MQFFSEMGHSFCKTKHEADWMRGFHFSGGDNVKNQRAKWQFTDEITKCIFFHFDSNVNKFSFWPSDWNGYGLAVKNYMRITDNPLHLCKYALRTNNVLIRPSGPMIKQVPCMQLIKTRFPMEWPKATQEVRRWEW